MPEPYRSPDWALIPAKKPAFGLNTNDDDDQHMFPGSSVFSLYDVHVECVSLPDHFEITSRDGNVSISAYSIVVVKCNTSGTISKIKHDCEYRVFK